MAVTRHEFDLLYALASNPGIVFTRERLLAEVWQGEAFVTERSVDTLVRRLRCKIERHPSSPALICTVWGEGYKFTDAPLSVLCDHEGWPSDHQWSQEAARTHYSDWQERVES